MLEFPTSKYMNGQIVFPLNTLSLVSRASNFIRNTVKRALGRDEEDILTPKRLALQDDNFLQIQNFMKIFDDPVMRSLLKFDSCNLLADNYLIAIAYIYLDRAKILLSKHDVHYLLSALYLAHEVQEDLRCLREKIIPWYPGTCTEMKSAGLHYFKNKIWIQMNFKCHVTKKSCDELMKRTAQWDLWKRKRESSHSGAFRFYQFEKTKCKHCCKSYQYNLMVSDVNNNELQESAENTPVSFTTSDWEIDSNSDDVLSS
ncbi:speedy protein A-like [Planococcus citri]|uniref:speedy protein A-like n=1 Tax=Planococcus citri TaxID=170843 RepID=UPI0031F8F362